MLKFEKYQSIIFSSDSVANIEKKFGRTFSWVCMDFLKKSQPKKWNFDQNRINLTKILVILTKKKFPVFKLWQCLEQNEIQSVCQKIPIHRFFFF